QREGLDRSAADREAREGPRMSRAPRRGAGLAVVIASALALVGCASTGTRSDGMASMTPGEAPVPAALLTVAERSNWTATATYDQTLALCTELDRRSDLVSLSFMGETVEGRRIPLLIVGDPPHPSATRARGDGKLVV